MRAIIVAFIVAFMGRLPHLCIMSRPMKKPDPNLAAAIRAHMTDHGLSARRLAKILDCSVSTLTRSLKDGCFSDSLTKAVATELGPKAARPEDLLQEALHILQQVDIIRQNVEKIVRSALKRLQAAH